MEITIERDAGWQLVHLTGPRQDRYLREDHVFIRADGTVMIGEGKGLHEHLTDEERAMAEALPLIKRFTTKRVG